MTIHLIVLILPQPLSPRQLLSLASNSAIDKSIAVSHSNGTTLQV